MYTCPSVKDNSTSFCRNLSQFVRIRWQSSYGLDPASARGRQTFPLTRASPQTVSTTLPREEASLPAESGMEEIIFSSEKSLLDPQQVAALWNASLGRVCSLESVERALENSFGVSAAYVVNGEEYELIGLARCLSDGVVTALLADICVLPDFQLRGIGKELFHHLVLYLQRNGPRGFAAFPTEDNWKFLWKCGFRWNRRFKTLTYKP